jgi:dihydrofolate reductase
MLMRKLTLFMHVSLDGFVAGPNGEMEWIHVDEEIFDYVGRRTAEASTALYGRVTFEMMDNYWPAAGEQPEASRHDVEHSEWYNRVPKVVLSRTLDAGDRSDLVVIREDLSRQIDRLKQQPGGEILMFGSPTAAHALMAEGLIDEYWLFVNPVLLAQGIPLFGGLRERQPLRLIETHRFPSDVVCLHYAAIDHG